MLTPLLRDLWWLGPVLGLVFYLTNYWLRIATARYYRTQTFAVFEGLEDSFGRMKNDILAARWWSPTIGIESIVRALILAGVRWILVPQLDAPSLYLLFLGAILLYDVANHFRSLANLWIWKSSVSTKAVKGRAEYAKWVAAQRWGAELVLFAGLYLICFVLTGNWIFLGGVIMCLLSGLANLRTAAALRAGAPSDEQPVAPAKKPDTR